MFTVLFSFALLTVANCVQFHIVNNAGGPINVGIQGNDGRPALENGGFVLLQHETRVVNSPDDWAGRFWPRTWCDPNSNHCETGDCGNRLQCGGNGGAPPATLAEITLRGHAGLDFYDISLVDGFNIGASIEPIGGQGECRPVACTPDLNPACPNELKLIGSAGYAIGCLSSCAKFNTDQYCCRGQWDQPYTCNPNDWAVNSARYFKSSCPDAYSYAYDDETSTFTCISNAYRVVFG